MIRNSLSIREYPETYRPTVIPSAVQKGRMYWIDIDDAECFYEIGPNVDASDDLTDVPKMVYIALKFN